MKWLHRSIPAWVLLPLALGLVVVVAASIIWQQTIPMSAIIVRPLPGPPATPTPGPTPSLRLYLDAQFTQPATSVAWGTLQTGGLYSRALFIRNEGAGAASWAWTSTLVEPLTDTLEVAGSPLLRDTGRGSLTPGQSAELAYRLRVPEGAQAQPVNWEVRFGYE